MFVEVTVTHVLNRGVGFFPQSPAYKLYVNGDHIVKLAKQEDEAWTVMTLSDGVVYAISETPYAVANKLNGGEDRSKVSL
ncbi:TPA: hypothetical protein ONC25_002584 [Enterobacter asburiae]|nr:hypothetical protein [Enterobacter asburiae]